VDTSVLAIIAIVVVAAALVAFLWMRRRARRPAAPQLSATSEDRTFVGISSASARSDATVVGPMAPRSDATVVDVRASAPSAPAPSDAPTVAMTAPPAPPEAATLPTVRIPKLHARVTVTKGGSGTHELGPREHSIGRSTQADIVLADPSVSGHHAKLVPHGDAFAITDLGSTNGTTVDGRAVEGEHVLRGGETIGIGDARLRYERLA
jgi:hypothetical protein